MGAESKGRRTEGRVAKLITRQRLHRGGERHKSQKARTCVWAAGTTQPSQGGRTEVRGPSTPVRPRVPGNVRISSKCDTAVVPFLPSQTSRSGKVTSILLGGTPAAAGDLSTRQPSHRLLMRPCLCWQSRHFRRTLKLDVSPVLRFSFENIIHG